jgi:integrase
MKLKRESPTVRQLFQSLLETHYSKEQFVASGYRTEVTNLFSRHIDTTLGAAKVCQLDAPTIFRWHAGLKKTPYVANRAKAVLSKILSFAEQEGLIPAGSNPCAAVANHKEQKRRRYASDEEVSKIGAVLRRYEESHPKETSFLYLLMMTGSRPLALERATFEDLTVIPEGALLRAKGKTGVDEIFIPIKALKLISAGGNTGSLVGKFPRLFWQRVREEAGCPDLWARDLRRTFGTTGLSIGVTRGVVGELLNHKSEQTTKIYSLLKPDAKIEAAQSIAEELDRLLGAG